MAAVSLFLSAACFSSSLFLFQSVSVRPLTFPFLLFGLTFKLTLIRKREMKENLLAVYRKDNRPTARQLFLSFTRAAWVLFHQEMLSFIFHLWANYFSLLPVSPQIMEENEKLFPVPFHFMFSSTSPGLLNIKRENGQEEVRDMKMKRRNETLLTVMKRKKNRQQVSAHLFPYECALSLVSILFRSHSSSSWPHIIIPRAGPRAVRRRMTEKNA